MDIKGEESLGKNVRGREYSRIFVLINILPQEILLEKFPPPGGREYSRIYTPVKDTSGLNDSEVKLELTNLQWKFDILWFDGLLIN